MKSFLTYPIFALACTFALSVGASLPEMDQPFPEVIHVEKADNANENLVETFALMDQLGWNEDDAYLYRIHQDAYYHIKSFSDNGDVVQLLDGSKWSVHPSQGIQVLYWVQTDDIFIKPHSSCFSSYQYVLHNRTTQQAVEANLIHPPLPMAAATFRILHIEPYNRMIHLSDNTIWQVDANDSNFPYWQVGQRLMIGLNNNWRSEPMPHILINVDIYKNPYSQANFYGYAAGY